METNIETEKKSNGESGFLEEGKAKILLDEKNIFYNPVQEFNRDLSIAVLTEYYHSKKEHDSLQSRKSQKNGDNVGNGSLRVLEALSATGLRSIRYAKEVAGIGEIIANDISNKAVEAIKRNIIANGVESLVTPSHSDATMLMYENRKSKFDAIDLDPYGCPSIFLDAAVQSIKDNGLLLVTATDMAVLAGNSPETCYVKYGAISLKSKSCHEMALRILLQHVASHAARYGKVITPLLSISVDFYIRIFLKIHSSQIACKSNISNLGLVYQCTGCESFTIQPLGIKTSNNVNKLPVVPSVDKLCQYCKHKYHMGGPIWTGVLHNKNFVQNIIDRIESEEDNNLKSLKTLRRIQGLLRVVHEELDNPLYYQLDRLMSIIKSNVPPMVQFRSALLNAGYRVSYSHANKQSVKTDAPNQVIWDIVKAWEKENPVKREKFDANSAGLAILNSESTTSNISFEKHLDAIAFSQKQRLTRYQVNPSAYWGPGTKSTTIIQDQRTLSKKEKNQNKNKRKKMQNDSEIELVKEKKMHVTSEENSSVDTETQV